ncbi:hypothetical protein Cni_G26109 [Canna indica]|uniref:Uncharacterized protein n=1 Tax=Canna indica TaxID=4628 RepID=A0AAQ3L2B5_9LILI|nr:hypothetical protein Cni_G26109 [Canna indica]
MEIKVKHLQRVESDHRPILMDLEGNLKETLCKIDNLERKDVEGWISEGDLLQLDILVKKANALVRKWQKSGSDGYIHYNKNRH